MFHSLSREKHRPNGEAVETHCLFLYWVCRCSLADIGEIISTLTWYPFFCVLLSDEGSSSFLVQGLPVDEHKGD